MNDKAEPEGEVCLVDDDPSVLRSMRYLLESDGLATRAFNKPEDFLSHVATNNVPVVVLDIWMDKVKRPGSAGTALRHFACYARHRHHGARRPGCARHRHGHRSGRLLH